jgi:hypothetical protein
MALKLRKVHQKLATQHNSRREAIICDACQIFVGNN